MKRFNTQLTLSAITLGLISTVGIVASPAEAAILMWKYSFDNTWMLTGGSATSVVPDGNGGSTASWGTPVNPGGPQSSLSIVNIPNPGPGTVNTFFGPVSAVPAGSFVDFAKITHNNQVVKTGTSITGGKLISNLTLTPMTPPGAPTGPLPAIYSFNFLETPNISPCAVLPSSSICDDIFVLTNIDIGGTSYNPYDQLTGSDEQLAINLPLPSPPFPNHDGDLYNFLLKLGGPTGGATGPGVLRVLTPAECAAASSISTQCVGFTTEENKATMITNSFAIQIEKKGVPEPSASAALVGAGLVSFGLLRKRKQNS